MEHELINDLKNYLKDHWKKSKRIPRLNKIADDFSIDRNKVVEILRYLETEGFIKRNYNQYKVNQEKIKPTVKEFFRMDIASLSIPVIRTVMAIIGLGAALMSVYYTANWLLEFLHPAWSFLLSSIMVLFSVSSFEVIIIYWQRKEFHFVPVFAILWVVVIVFSMISTVAGQYNQRVSNDIQASNQNAELSLKKQTLDFFDVQEKTIADEIAEKKSELETMNKMFSEFTLEERSENGGVFWDTYNKIQVVDSELKKLRSELSRIRSERIEFLKTENESGLIVDNRVEAGSFYVWMGSIFDVDVKLIEFWLSMFPAIFIDVIAPLAIAVAMFLKKERKK